MTEAQPKDPLSSLRVDRSAAPSRRRGRWRRWLIFGALLLAALVIEVVVQVNRAPTVRVAEVRTPQPGEQQTELSAAGYVDSRRRSIVAPQVAGRLVDVAVDEGDAVKAGQVLARLDDRDARVALDQAEAQVRAAQARLASAEAHARNTAQDRARAERLAGQGVIATQDLQGTQTASLAAAAELRVATALLAAARRAEQAARLQLSHTVVRAPFDATVSRKLADEGAVLAPAALDQANLGGIVELVDLQALEVEAEVSEEQLSRIRTGQPALIFLDAFPERAFRARVGTVRPTIDRSKATAVVKVRFLEVPKGALPDMGAKVSFLSRDVPPAALDPKAQQARVPASAVVSGEGGSSVWVVKDGRVDRQPVQVGERVGDEVALRAGPPPGTPVVLAPDVKRLHEGRRVKVEAGSG